MTINETYRQWMEEKRGGLRPASLSTYTVLAERYILPEVGEQEAVSTEDVERIVAGMVAAGKSAKTRQLTLNVLNNMLRFAGQPSVRVNHKVGNSMAILPSARINIEGGIPGTGPSTTPSATPILPRQAVRELLTALQQHPTPRNIGLYLALTTGIRASELCALRWQDVDEALHIRGSISYLWDTEKHTWRPKEAGEQDVVPRDIPLTQKQRRFLQKHRGAPATYIVTGENRPMQPHSLRASTQRFLQQNGLKGYSLADFRHTFAARCLKAGCNFTTLGALLGVQSLQLLQKKYGRFAQMNPEAVMAHQMEEM